MKIKNLLPAIITVTMIFTFLSCEEFISSQNESNLHKTEITISGSITNIFTQAEVYGASIQLGDNYQTVSDINGQFSIQYQLTLDDERDKSVQLNITEKDYLPLTQNLIIYPVDYQMDISLTYASPIVKNSVLVLYQFPHLTYPLYVCQALVQDYQGFSDINSVEVTFYYKNTLSGEKMQITANMIRIENVSELSSHFQSTAYTQIHSLDLQHYVDITASDKLEYSCFQRHIVFPEITDTLLFTPIYTPPPEIDSVQTFLK